MRPKKRLGDMLIEARLLTPEQLREALIEQPKSGLRLGAFLIRKGTLSEIQIVNMLCNQLRIARFSPENFRIDKQLSELLPKEMALKFKVAPLGRRGRLFTLGVVDPMDIAALDAVEDYVQSEVEPVICTEKEYAFLLNAIYGIRSNIDNVIREVAESQEDQKEETKEETRNEVIGGDDSEEAPVVRLVNSILVQAVRDGASDVHISPEKNYIQLRFRIDGKLFEIPPPPKSMFYPIISRLKILADMDIATSRIPQDGRFTVNLNGKDINIRASTLPTIYGENMVMRLHDTSVGVRDLIQSGMTRDDLETIEKIIDKPWGMILVSGPTGSGKTSTLYAMLKKIDKAEINLITLEDPVETRLERARQVQLNPKAGMTFASALRSVLRQDPDVIMVGEIRDKETAEIAVQAALTGHRLFSTVHTNDAAGCINRLIDMEIEPFLVSSALLGCIAQRLIRTICLNCKQPYTPPVDLLKRMGVNDELISKTIFYKGRGCSICHNTGYKGRTAIFEILLIDEIVREMILKRKSSTEITNAMRDAGKFKALKDAAIAQVLAGVTTLEDALGAAMT